MRFDFKIIKTQTLNVDYKSQNCVFHLSNQNCLPKWWRYLAAPIQIFLLTMSLTLAGLWPLILHRFIDDIQSVSIDDTDTIPLNTQKVPINVIY